MHNRYAVVVRTTDGDRLRSVTGTVTNPTVSPIVSPTGSPARRVVRGAVRRAATVAAVTSVLLTAAALLAGPASAEVPLGWGEEEPVDKVFVLGVLVGIPVLLFVVIAALVYLPGLVRGERVTPGATGPEDQWLGGRRSAGEIASTPTAGSPADAGVESGGGASARW